MIVGEQPLFHFINKKINVKPLKDIIYKKKKKNKRIIKINNKNKKVFIKK